MQTLARQSMHTWSNYLAVETRYINHFGKQVISLGLFVLSNDEGLFVLLTEVDGKQTKVLTLFFSSSYDMSCSTFTGW